MGTDKTAYAAKKSKPAAEKGQQNRYGPQSQFIQYELSKEQSATCKAQQFDGEAFSETLFKLVDAGYKVTFNFDERNNAFGCWFLPQGEKHVNAGFILTGRGSSPIKAFKQAAFKHYTLFDTLWGEYAAPNNADEIDD